MLVVRYGVMVKVEFVVSSIQVEGQYYVVGFSPTDAPERLQRLLTIAKRKWTAQMGAGNQMPIQYTSQIIGNGVPPMIMRFLMVDWNGKGINLNDKVIIDTPEHVDDIHPVKKEEIGR